MNTPQNRYRAFLVTLIGLAMSAGAQAASPDLLSREVCKEALPQVASTLAGVLEPVRRAGHCIAGDFNGDGKPDVLMVVKVLAAGAPSGAAVRTIYPFYDKEGAKGRLRFLALHSTPASGPADWLRHDRLLLDGESPILVLRHEETSGDLERVTRRSKEVTELRVPRRHMRGEAVLLGTEAVSAILYWNGKTWVFHEDPAGP